MIKRTFDQMLSSRFDDYNSPEYWTIEGVEVMFKESYGAMEEDDWKYLLDKSLPVYGRHGWLEGFEKIVIGDNVIGGDNEDAVAQYVGGAIYINSNRYLPEQTDEVVGSKWPVILTHEFIHHAHLMIEDFPVHRHTLSSETANMLEAEVSEYATESVKEAIAEIGAGTMHGKEYSDEVYNFYEEHNGPTEVYDGWHADTTS